MGQITSSRMRDPRPLVRRFKISAAVSISSCPVRNTKMSPGTACGGRGEGEVWEVRGERNEGERKRREGRGERRKKGGGGGGGRANKRKRNGGWHKKIVINICGKVRVFR